MDCIKLSEIANTLGVNLQDEREVEKIVIDSREADEKSLFVAIAGENFDGHNFVQSVIENGCPMAVCEYLPENVPSEKVILTPSTRKAFLDIAGYYRRKFDIPVIALTGSVGKTTTKEMIAAVVSKKYKTIFTQGNLNNEIGLPKMCFQINKETQAAVLEMGMNHFGEISNLSKTAKPTIGLITNIGLSHIENLGSQDGILKAKLEILNAMEKESPLILNGDDPLLRKAAENIENPIIFYGIDNPENDFKAVEISQNAASMMFTVEYKGISQFVTLPAIGRHNVLNAVAAFAVGDKMNIAPEMIAQALGEYTPAGMRQKVTEKNGIFVIEDCYNASPDSIKAALSALESMPAAGKKIAVLGDMLELGSYAQKAHTICGKTAGEKNIDMLFAYGENAKYYLEGISPFGIDAHLHHNKDELTDDLERYITHGDAVLFKASRGMKLEEVIMQLYERWENK